MLLDFRPITMTSISSMKIITWLTDIVELFKNVYSSIATMQNPYISWVPNDLTIKSVADWLVESGYTQGCGTFWNSDVITELSDGKIEMWTVSDMNELSTYQWLQETSHDTEKPDGKFFIIVTPDEYTQNAETWKLSTLTDYLVYGDDNYFVFAFDSVEEYLEL